MERERFICLLIEEGEMVRKNGRLYPRLTQPDFLILSFLRDAIARHVNDWKGTVVDYGCGRKPYRPLFPDGTKYIGVDFEVKDSEDLPLTKDSGLPLKNDSADFIVSFQVIEHVPNVDFYLSECWRVLKLGGSILITTHGSWPYHPGPNNDDYLRWTHAGLQKIMERHRFSVKSIEGVCTGWFSALQQFLVFRDPARITSGLFKNFFLSIINIFINCLSIMLLKIGGIDHFKGDILPICYSLLAVK
jgi:SAM-dependent methyltransferase